MLKLSERLKNLTGQDLEQLVKSTFLAAEISFHHNAIEFRSAFDDRYFKIKLEYIKPRKKHGHRKPTRSIQESKSRGN